jgi:hypothetical protein
MAIDLRSDPARSLIAELERKYVWWQPVGSEPHSPECVIAQAMNLGTFEDIRRLEQTLGPACLAEVMLGAAPGWLSDRSWEFWRGRLSLSSGAPLPGQPPRRALDAEAL